MSNWHHEQQNPHTINTTINTNTHINNGPTIQRKNSQHAPEATPIADCLFIFDLKRNTPSTASGTLLSDPTIL